MGEVGLERRRLELCHLLWGAVDKDNVDDVVTYVALAANLEKNICTYISHIKGLRNYSLDFQASLSLLKTLICIHDSTIVRTIRKYGEMKLELRVLGVQ